MFEANEQRTHRLYGVDDFWLVRTDRRGVIVVLDPGDRHLFADSSLPSYDHAAARLLTERVVSFLNAVAQRWYGFGGHANDRVAVEVDRQHRRNGSGGLLESAGRTLIHMILRRLRLAPTFVPPIAGCSPRGPTTTAATIAVESVSELIGRSRRDVIGCARLTGTDTGRMSHDAIELLTDLVAIDSVNPSLSPGAAGEGEIAEYVRRWAADTGLRTHVLQAHSGRPSVVVRGGDAAGGATLMLCGHLDTVGVVGMTDPLTPRVDGDRVYGRGAYDMKAGLAAALVACRDADLSGISGEVVVAAVADEEHASIGVREVLEQVGADAAIVTEPTELAVATAHKGFVWLEIGIVGRAAHGSRPHLGIDAILKSGPILVALSDLNDQLRAHQHPLLGAGNLHGSLISGGSEESTIPDRCTLTIERRTLPGETAADVEHEVSELLARCGSMDPELDARHRTTLVREPFEVTDTTPIVTAVADAAARTLGRRPDSGGVSYWADSAFIAAAGIPTVLFGPAGDGAHAQVEWVSIDSTIACVDTLTAVATSFCR